MCASAVAGTIYALLNIISGNRYIEKLNWVDATTVLMISVLLFRGLAVLESAPDLTRFAVPLVNALSFIYAFESIYKFLFFGWAINPAELRELLLQIAITLSILLGFYHGDFEFTRASKLWGIAFLLTMVLWVAIGFPQLFDLEMSGYPRLITLNLPQDAVWAINRLAKVFLFFCYLYLYAKPNNIKPPGLG